MKALFLSAFVLVFAATTCQVEASEDGVNLVNLGNVEGKSYFAGTSQMNWMIARDLCRNSGMELATITTQAQVDFLKSKYNSTTFSGYYWIGARDSQSFRALSWDSTDTEIETLFGIKYRHFAAKYQICAAYYSGTDETVIDAYECTMNDVTGLICET
ncbi:P-selectin [Orchesella cincta]|uniref:P-selectin n=1 Tax=Orchesella cincta TaxID=48709 RepID=A0A1D2MGA4_ORCCI|nr:P-selectin [Orchesella cincta]